MLDFAVRILRRYIEPFYPTGAEEQGLFLNDAPHKADTTTIADEPVKTAESSKIRFDFLQRQINNTDSTVVEIEAKVKRCRHEVDTLFSDWIDEITNEYTQKFDERAAAIDSKLKNFDQTLEKVCVQAGNKAAAYMEEVVVKHNEKVQQVSDDLKEQLVRLEEKIGEKADSSETARLAAENLALKVSLVKFERDQKSLHATRDKNLLQCMRDNERLTTWLRGLDKEHKLIVEVYQADANNRQILDRHIRAMELEKQQAIFHKIPFQPVVPVSRGPSAFLGCEDAGCGQHEAKITELVKALGDYERRLRNLEDATTRASSCQCSHGSFKRVNKDLKNAKDSLEHEKLESQQRLEEHKTSAKAQYQALEAKFDNLACEVKELPSLPVHLKMVARVEELEQEKRWKDRVLENALRAELQQDVPAPSLQLPAIVHEQETEQTHQTHQTQQTQQTQQPQESDQPEHVQIEASVQQNFQEEVLAEPTLHMEATFQSICAERAVQGTKADETAQEETSHMEAFGVGMVSNFQVPPIEVPTIDWSASVSVDLTRDASEFDNDGLPRPKAEKDKLPTMMEEDDMDTVGRTTTISCEAEVSHATVSTATDAPNSPEDNTLSQVANSGQEIQEPVLVEHNSNGLQAPQSANDESPFSVTAFPTKSSPNISLTVPDLDQQGSPSSQPLHGGNIPSGYTTVYGTQSVTPTLVSLPSAERRPLYDGNLSPYATSSSSNRCNHEPQPNRSITYQFSQLAGGQLWTVAVQNARQMAHPRPIIQKPKGRMNKMSDEQRNAIRHEMEQQKPVVDRTLKLPRILPRLPTPPRPTVAPAQVTGASGKQSKGAQASQVASSSTTVDDRADKVDYGSTDDDRTGPSNPSANTVPTPTVLAMNLGWFAESNEFGESADKWTAIVSNANVDIKPQTLLSEAKIAVTRQLYSRDNVEKIAEAFFEVCMVQNGSFMSAIDNFDAFNLTNYHQSFLDAFQSYLQDHPANSY